MGKLGALVKFAVCAVVLLPYVNARPFSEAGTASSPSSLQKVDCRNYDTDFTQSTAGWIAENTAQDTYTITDGGIQMNLVPPTQYIRMHDANSSK